MVPVYTIRASGHPDRADVETKRFAYTEAQRIAAAYEAIGYRTVTCELSLEQSDIGAAVRGYVEGR